ncbi:replication protein [bream circovirus 1]
MPKQATKKAAKRPSTKRDNPVKRWCFTLNNYVEADLERLKTNLTEAVCEFAVIGKEKGESGTPHLQGFVNLKTKARLSSMKEVISPRAHFEPAKGTDLQNDEYCTKDNDIYLRIGEPSKQGKRSDLLKAVELLHSTSGNITEVARACPATFIRYGRGLRDYWLTVGATPRNFKTEVFILIGPPGCGKSRYAFDATCDKPVFYKQRGDWWDGYMAQEAIIIDDFYGWMKYDEMLRICDRYPHKVPVKGSFVEFSAKKIYITSNEHVINWYKFDGYDAKALMRRVTSYKMWYNNDFIEMNDMTLVQCPIKQDYNY